jgi:hypothetical protein
VFSGDISFRCRATEKIDGSDSSHATMAAEVVFTEDAEKTPMVDEQVETSEMLGMSAMFEMSTSTGTERTTEAVAE